jgi:membrane protein CcdC involved in cytochrome C biogenesis
MFVIGMELIKVLKTKPVKKVISHASIVIPFALGIGLSYFVFNQFAPEGVQFLSSVCLWNCHDNGLPVLARIVQEREIHKLNLSY